MQILCYNRLSELNSDFHIEYIDNTIRSYISVIY